MKSPNHNSAPACMISDDRGAFDAAGLARAIAKPALRRLIILQAARTTTKLAFLGGVAILIGDLVMERPADTYLPIAIALLLAATVLIGWLAERIQAGAETGVSIEIRQRAKQRLQAMTARQIQSLPVGGLAISMQRHPDAIASLALGHRIASIMMGLGPLIAAMALLLVSWQAALLVLMLSPVMIIFFVLVGETIRKRAQAQERAFGKLAGQFEDRIRTLPTILANHALQGEEAKLSRRLTAYADNTMSVLRIAFLNSGIIDFFSSLSIAMLAVFLGLGHLKLAMIHGFSALELWQSLFILMIAPEYFAPFRRFSEQYHVKAEGQAAAAALDDLLGVKGTSEPNLAMLDLPEIGTLPPAGMIAIVGPSGCGKTTLLRRICGVDGQASLINKPVVWVGTTSFVPEGKLAEAIGWGLVEVDPSKLEQVADKVGLLVDAHLPGGLNAQIERGGVNLSGGQRLRIAIARALLSDGVVVADEPTAKLDQASAELARKSLREMSPTQLVIVATHDMELAKLASRTVDLSIRQLREAA